MHHIILSVLLLTFRSLTSPLIKVPFELLSSMKAFSTTRPASRTSSQRIKQCWLDTRASSTLMSHVFPLPNQY